MSMKATELANLNSKFEKLLLGADKVEANYEPIAPPKKQIGPRVLRKRTDESLAKRHLLKQIKLIVSDECHRQTNEETEGARALDDLAGAGCKLLMLSGTPVQNSINDLGCIFKLIAPDRFNDVDLLSRYNFGANDDQNKRCIETLCQDLSPYVDRQLAVDVIFQ